MAVPESPAAGPKPFVFVLMPFGKEFNDIYKFGIKGAAEEVGAYAERVDEQMFAEGILDHIFNQIDEADVIVADMTGRNPNVFYEVGYAHALNKIVLLLTQTADDIPFDLKHRQHIIYGREISTLRAKLTERLTWAIGESRRREEQNAIDRLTVSHSEIDIPELSLGRDVPLLDIDIPKLEKRQYVSFTVRNEGTAFSEGISHVYLFTEENPFIRLYFYELQRASDLELSKTGLPQKCSLSSIRPIPPGEVDSVSIRFDTWKEVVFQSPTTLRCCLRFYTRRGPLYFPFRIRFSPPSSC